MPIIRNSNLLNHDYIYNENFNDKPTLVLIHGLYGDMNNLGVIEKNFKNKFNILKMDLVNHGRSFYSNKIDYNDMSNNIKDICDYYHLNSLILIGHSMGGKVAMTFANNYPEITSGLIVLDIAPVVYGKRGHENIFKVLEEVKNSDINDRTSAQNYLKKYLDLGVALFLSKSFTIEEPHKFLFNTPVLKDEYINISMWKNVKYNRLTLFIKGSKSEYLSDERTLAIKDQFPNHYIVEIKDAGHWLHAEKPEEVLYCINEYINKISNAI